MGAGWARGRGVQAKAGEEHSCCTRTVYRGIQQGGLPGCRFVDSSALEVLFVSRMGYGCPVACRAVCLCKPV